MSESTHEVGEYILSNLRQFNSSMVRTAMTVQSNTIYNREHEREHEHEHDILQHDISYNE